MSSNPQQFYSKILYIDDNALNRSLVKRLLNNHGIEVVEASTGLEGIAIARETAPSLILMDVNMPGLDGHETTTRMRGIPSLESTPIVAVTARTTKGERELALVAGCDGYIPKPINVDKFPRQIISYLDGYQDKLTKDERSRYLDQYSQKLVERLETKVIELEDANLRLRKIDKVKSDFITLAAHELRTPLSLVYGYATILQSATSPEKDSIEVDVSKLSHKIYDASHRLNEVVNDILNISLVNTNEMQLLSQEVDIYEIVKSALMELKPVENNRQLTIDYDALKTISPIISDRKKLRQVFWNILSNAIKYTPDGGSITLTPQIFSSSTEFTNQFKRSTSINKGLVICVKDTGIGLNKSDQLDIFEQFYVVGDISYHRSSKTAFGGGGMGLGLPIAQGIIKAHQGEIWVESDGLGQGSIFYIHLPYQRESDEL